jgi:hypothetical protein
MPELDLLIEQKQGARIAYAGDSSSEQSPAQPPPPPDLGSTSTHRLPEASFFVLLVNAALGLAFYYFGNSSQMWNLSAAITLIELTLAVLAVRPSLYQARSAARGIAILALLLMILDFAGGIALTVRNWDVIQKGAALESVPNFREYVWIGSAVRLVLGSLGLLFRFRDRSRVVTR